MSSIFKGWLWAAMLLALSACGWEYTATGSHRQPLRVQTISGTISGLSGTGLVLQNVGDGLAVNANGSFAFTVPIAVGSAYNVTVLAQPVSPSQTCTVVNGTGIVADTPVTNVQLACVVMGDINGDGVVDHKDVVLAERIALGLTTATPDQLARGDIHVDGTIDISDYLLIQKLGLGL